MDHLRALPPLEIEDFRLLRELINDYSGVWLADEMRPTVERRLRDRLQVLHKASFRDYYYYLRYHPDKAQEMLQVMEELTVNETYFFRELPQLRAFQSQVLPELRERAAVRRALNVWSAGCSTGEEVYTLAMLIDESELFEGWDVRVFGSDISRRVLQIARAGIYRESSFRALPDGYGQYFQRTTAGRVVVPHIRAMCYFGQFNLFDDARSAIVGQVDAVFCRNVLIYFDHESRRRLIRMFYEQLHPGGYLMLGHSESLLHASTDFELAHLDGDLAYRKGGSATSNVDGARK